MVYFDKKEEQVLEVHVFPPKNKELRRVIHRTVERVAVHGEKFEVGFINLIGCKHRLLNRTSLKFKRLIIPSSNFYSNMNCLSMLIIDGWFFPLVKEIVHSGRNITRNLLKCLMKVRYGSLLQSGLNEYSPLFWPEIDSLEW